MSPARNTRKVRVWDQRLDLTFQVCGQGPALIYFHPAAGPGWDPFLDKLAESYTVYAPEFPGTTIGDPYAIHAVDNIGDAVLLYEEAIRALGLEGAIAIGQSFGGMLALELASTFPNLFKKLVVLDSVGLWDDKAPIANWMEKPPEQLPGLLFKDPSRPAAHAVLAMPQDPDAAVHAMAQLVWNFGCTGKMIWPIPERGLHKRLHRVSVPTLIIWGEEDALIPVYYANEFGRRIKGSVVKIVKDSGHIPQVEQCETTLELVKAFL